MNKRKKIIFLISGIGCVFLLILGIGLYFLHHFFEKSVNEKVGLLQTVDSFLTLNFDGEKEKQLKEERSMMNVEHVSIYYFEDDAVLLPITNETLDWAKELNDDLLGDYKKRPLDLIYFKDTEELSHFASLNNISGYYSDFDKVIGIISEDKEGIVKGLETPLFHFQKTLLHEYTHYAFNQKLNQLKITTTIPQWFEEGVCEYVSYDQTILSPSPFTFVPLNELTSYEDWNHARTIDDIEPYKQSYLTIDFLIGEYGKEVIVEILEATKSHSDFNKGYENVTGIPLVKVEEQVIQSVKIET
ncbi:collagenase [Bacillus weihaiensis]|uniref:collagenase n=1 Tax=Bacillus weihaiensis TaxID=1547283 RepID=UPI0023554367|nr:collagenase [Bacillus weihaiensis]